MDFFAETNQIDKSVKSGELNQAGKLAMPPEGEAILFKIDTEVYEGRNYIRFVMTLPGSTDYRDWGVRCPAAGDTDAAKWMGMQNIYNTLFGVMKRDPKSMLIDKCFEELKATLEQHSIKVTYTTEQNEYIAQRGPKAGEQKKATYLRTITGISKITKITNIEVKPKIAPQSQSNANWGQASTTPFTPSEEIPF